MVTPCKRGERGRGGGLDAVGQGLLGGEISGAEQAEAVDQQHLLVRRAADQPAILELGGGERARQPGLAARDPRHAALDEQRRRRPRRPRR